MATLVSAVITSIRYDLKDTNTSNPNWTDDEILDKINQAQEIIFQRLVAKKSDTIVSSTSFSLVAGTENYAVPSKFWEHQRLYISGEEKPLDQVDYSVIETYNSNFGSHNDTPNRFAIYKDYFYLRPIPDTAYTMLLRYYAQPTELTTSSNMPFKEIYNQAIKKYAIAQCFLRDEFNIDKENSSMEGLINAADGLIFGRNKSLKRINAYRWEYEGLV